MRHRVPFLRKAILIAGVSFALAGCSVLPRSGPDDGVIARGAETTLTSAQVQALKTKYALLDINNAILPYFKETLLTSFAPGFKGGRTKAPAIPVGIGDTVKVTIFESSSGGLFIPSEGGSRPGNFVELPEQTIDRSGTIRVPYVGRVRAAGYSAGAIEDAVVKALQNRAIEPQVMVTTTSSRSSQVTILGDVGTSQKIDINANGERILDVLSRSGGISGPAEEAYITVTRKGRKSRVLFKTIIDNPRENVFVYPGDSIFVDRERRTFVAMGATGTLGRVDFKETDLSLAEAIGEVGGLNDERADPAQVFVYRPVHRKTLLKAGADLDTIDEAMVPTIFRLNMREPGSLFLAQKFAMQDKDILYVSNADSIEIFKVLDFVTGVTGAAANTVGNLNATRISAEDLVN